jgi:biotin carboxyl carrier protein
MEHRLQEILEEVVEVRRELAYPVMATPYSQIVGAQAMENVVSGGRYKQVPDEVIKYVLGYYGEPVVPIDRNVVERVMGLPRAKELSNRKPLSKSLEDLRHEIGPELSDDEFLLKVLIPGKHPKRSKPEEAAPAPKESTVKPGGRQIDFPTEFTVEVDGEAFDVKVSPVWDVTEDADPRARIESAQTTGKPKRLKEIPSGAVICGMAGLVLSFEAKVGDSVGAGDLLAMIEAMKMRRHINAPHGGVVKEICAQEGEMVNPDDVLMVVA